MEKGCTLPNANSKRSSMKKKPPAVRDLLSEFCGYTTAHGLGRLSQSKNAFTRLVWSLFCIAAFTVFVIEVYSLLDLYLSKPVSTIVKVEHENQVLFPAVTICNINMIRAEKIPESNIQEVLANISSNALSHDSIPNEDDGFDETGNWSDEYEHENTSYYHETSEEGVKEMEFRIQEAIRAKVALENESILFSMGHQFQEFVFECSFKGYDCRNYSKYWHHFWDFRHGNCFTFNGGTDNTGQSPKVLVSHNTGPDGGLKLNLFIEQSQYIAELSHTAGAKVVIHNQGQMPFPDSEGLSVLPGRSTSFGIRRSVIERVDPFKNGSCVSDDNNRVQNIYIKKFNVSYSRQTCLNACLAGHQILQCGCKEAQFPNDAGVCDKRNSTTDRCLHALLEKQHRGELNCEKQCPSPCREVFFRTTLSMGEWPSYGYQEILEARVRDRKAYTSEQDFGYYLSENFLQVRIFFEQLNVERVFERVTYKSVNLAADIGGQLGLWIGISALTCCELLELVLLVVQSAFRRVFSSNVIHVKPTTTHGGC